MWQHVPFQAFDAPQQAIDTATIDMGRHNRRGYVGQTNLASIGSVERSPTRYPSSIQQVLGHGSSPVHDEPLPSVSRKRQLRAKWRLDLAPVPRPAEHHRVVLEPGASVEDVLSANIEATQHERKTFKDEPWYRSPIGRGSKSSIILAALKGQDYDDSGLVSRQTIIHTLQQSNFGLSNDQIHSLLLKYDPSQDMIHYKSFVKHLHFTEKPDPHANDHDVIYRHETYLEKIRDRAATLIDQSQPDASSLRLSPLSSVHKGPLAPLITNTEPSVVLGNSPTHQSPSRHLAPLSPTRLPVPDDPLSFENDKHRKAQRAQAKATILLSHISRIDEYARQQDVVIHQHDNLRIAAKAAHHGEHLARIYDGEHRQLYRLEHQGKALTKSPQTRAQRSVSKDSMFYEGGS